MACSMNSIHEGTAMWIFPIFMKTSAGTALSVRTSPTSSRRSYQEERLTSYCPAVSYSLKTYATDGIITEAYAYNINYNEPWDFNAIDYLQLLWKKSLHCGHVCKYYQQKALLLRAYVYRFDGVWRATVQRTREFPFKNLHEMDCHWRAFDGEACNSEG